MKLPKRMYAGVTDGMIDTHDASTDTYTPITVALFRSKREALKHYAHVVEVDAHKIFRVQADKPKN